MLACTALVGCSNEDELLNEEQGAKGNESYLAVKLVNPSAESRATGDYAFGSEAEQTVTSARFYLFDASGNPYLISDLSDPTNNNKNYVDATPNGTFNDPGTTNVETVLSAVLVINSSQKLPPASILAVLNYSDELTGNLSLTELKNEVANYGTINATNGAPYTNSGKFVMSNSVYVDAAGNIADVTPIAAENIRTTSELALSSPVEIYVERAAAKVQTVVKTSDTENPTDGQFFVKDNQYYANTGVVDASNNAIYARLKGWRVTNITQKSKLIKDLDATANNNPALTWTWNNAANCRSYWADANYDPSFVWNFNDASLPFTGTNWEYYNENTKNIPGEHDDNKNSQLLVAAEFVTLNSDGTVNDPQPIAEWYGVKYTLNGLKEVVADALASKLYKQSSTNTYISIEPADITFTQVAQTADDNRYLCNIGVASNTYYYKDGTEMKAYNATGNTTLESVVGSLQPAKLWGNMVNDEYVGGGYYYIDIVHNTGAITYVKDDQGNDTNEIASDTNVYGLVRNHWYKLTLNKLSGLGTPVYNPDMVITTEKPETDASFIAAEINVLAWRMVEQNVELK